MAVEHSSVTSIHKGAYIQSAAPTANLQAKVLWVDISASPPLVKKRNDDNNGWDILGWLLPALPSAGTLLGNASGGGGLTEINPAFGLAIDDDTLKLSGGTVLSTISGTAHTLSSSEGGAILVCTNANPVTITVPSGFGTDYGVWIYQAGAGAVTVVAGAGVTLRSPDGAATANQYDMLHVLAVASNEFLVRRKPAGGGGGGNAPQGADGDLQYKSGSAFAGSHLSQSGTQIVVASGKTIKTAAGSAAAPSLQIGQDDLGLFRQSADVLGLAHYGANYQIIGWNYHDIQRDDGAFKLNSTVAYKRNAGGDAEIAPDTGRGVIVKDARFMGRTSSAAPPSTTQLPNDKDWCFHRDTAGGKMYLAYNHAGTILKVELA